MKAEEQAKKIQKIIAKAWADEAFKERLLAKPAEVFAEEGIDVPKDVEIRVRESTSSVYYFVLPPKPTDVNISLVSSRIAAESSCFLSGH